MRCPKKDMGGSRIKNEIRKYFSILQTFFIKNAAICAVAPSGGKLKFLKPADFDKFEEFCLSLSR
jgi:hypothetical protein